ncbi:hypothetical protein CRG98_014615 [Punica granatum]|uniref:Uncharacterized protein n=1 Tax=Punica granatum TaxID=22663 RepID=A0A2I0K8X2_PUNGR|nr:hypothetical protein CRG98_014615 [Punica granatum]
MGFENNEQESVADVTLVGVVRTRILISSGYACACLRNAAWEYPPSRGRAADVREKESPPTILQLRGRGPVSYPGLGVWDTPSMLRQWSVRNRKFRIRVFYYVRAYIPHVLSVL